MEEISSSSESKEDPVSSDSSSSEGEDEDSPSASAHRLVTRSTPKKLISRPKQKAYKSKGSGPRSSPQKRSEVGIEVGRLVRIGIDGGDPNSPGGHVSPPPGLRL